MRLLYARLAARNYCGPAFRWFAPYRVKAVDLGRFDGAPGIHVRKYFKKEKHHERRKQENRKDRAGSKAGREGSEADRVVGAGTERRRGRQLGPRFPFERPYQFWSIATCPACFVENVARSEEHTSELQSLR